MYAYGCVYVCLYVLRMASCMCAFTFTFHIFNESKIKNTAAKHKKTDQRNNVEHQEITSTDKNRKNQTHFYSLISLWVTRINREGLLRDRGPANGANP